MIMDDRRGPPRFGPLGLSPYRLLINQISTCAVASWKRARSRTAAFCLLGAGALSEAPTAWQSRIVVAAG